jgi:hypothetical protein
MNKDAYKYQTFLLDLYNFIGLQPEKTPVLWDSLSNTKFLFYLHRCGYVEQVKCPYPPRNKRGKQASWWKITLKGIRLIYEIFGNKVIKIDDIPEITDKLLTL